MIRSKINGKYINNEVSVCIGVCDVEVIAVEGTSEAEGLNVSELMALKSKIVDFSIGEETRKMLVVDVVEENNEEKEVKIKLDFFL